MRIRETYTQTDFISASSVKTYQLEPGIYHYTVLLTLVSTFVPAPIASAYSINGSASVNNEPGPQVTIPEYPVPRDTPNLFSSFSGVTEVLAGPSGLVLAINGFNAGSTGRLFTLEMNAFLTKLG